MPQPAGSTSPERSENAPSQSSNIYTGFRAVSSAASPGPHEEERNQMLAKYRDEREAERSLDATQIPSGAVTSSTRANDSGLSSVTLTAPPGEGLLVHKQLRYESIPPALVISDADADRSCVELGLGGTLKTLNHIFHTGYTLDTPFVRPHIERTIDEAFDIGLALAYLRPRWHALRDLGPVLEETRVKDEQLRASVLREDRITNPFIPPRRVWDLWSNRVVPYWIMSSHLITPDLWAVSHSWMSLDKRRDILTNINGRKWPVPIPTDATLEQVRIELLNFGAEYAWLDVLCLRQYGGVEEHLRADEWKLDVPTIGCVYHAGRDRNIVCYFSGLGRPFTVEEGFIKDPRHWLNRAWTLQETRASWIVGGETDASPAAPKSHGDTVGDMFYEILDNVTMLFADRSPNVLLVLAAMQKRDSVNPVDKVAGLGYILRSTSLPIYKENESVEDAWTRLIENMDDRFRGDMLFLYPTQGDGKSQWRPSWRQIMQTEMPRAAGVEVAERIVYGFVEDVPKGLGHVYWYHGPTLVNCTVRGLSSVPPEKRKRRGELVVERLGKKHTFQVVAPHEQGIPEEPSVLAGGGGYEFWVVGKARTIHTDQAFLKLHKLSVLRMNDEERGRLQQLRLCVQRDVLLA